MYRIIDNILCIFQKIFATPSLILKVGGRMIKDFTNETWSDRNLDVDLPIGYACGYICSPYCKVVEPM